MLYMFFYMIFSDWLWRILYGAAIAVALGHAIGTEGFSKGGIVMIWIMTAGCAWWIAYAPASVTARLLRKAIVRR